jgi:hypothetical protein
MCCPHVARIAPAVKKTVNDRLLKSLKPAKPGQRYEVMDSIVPGFGVRVTDKGRRTFVLVARYPGSPNPTRRALGEYGALSLDKAREKARRWIEVLRQGRDPRAEEENQKFQELRQQENSFAAVAEEFIRLAVIGPDPKNPKQRKGPVVERELRREFIERWAKRTITSITPHDVIAVLDAAVTRGAPYQAHNLLGHIRRLFNWAIARGVSGFSKAKTRLDSLMLDELRCFAVDPNAVEIEPWTIHDIRRTVRTGLSALPIPDLVRELVIAHAKPGLHKVYDQYAYLNEKRQALELWATRLRAIVRDTAPQLVAACHTES